MAYKRGSVLWADLVTDGVAELRVVGGHPTQTSLVGCIGDHTLQNGLPVSFRRDGQTLGARAIWVDRSNLMRSSLPAKAIRLGLLATAPLTEDLQYVFGDLEEALETASSGAEAGMAAGTVVPCRSAWIRWRSLVKDCRPLWIRRRSCCKVWPPREPEPGQAAQALVPLVT